jgi:hypothetical protein
MHIADGAAFLAECKERAGRLRYAVEMYNGSPAWGRHVERKRDSLALYVWRHLR